MLNIEINDGIPKMDIEEEFDLLDGILDTKINREILKSIEQSQYYDKYNVLDRFGAKLNIRNLSTGCKAALLVANSSKKIDLSECGFNARDFIITRISNGSIVLHNSGVSIAGNKDINIDAIIDNKHFKTVRELDDYIQEEY